MNKQQEPRLRFQGFTGEWKTEGFESVGEFNPKAEIPRIFQYVDLESVVGTQLISYREEFKETAPSRAQRLAKNGDLFFQAVRPYQKNNYLFEKNNENFVFSTGYIQIRPQNDGYFLLTLVQKEEFVQEVLLRCTGTSYPAINTSSLQNIAILLPPTAEEQAHLGNFFRRLDSQIAESRAVLEKSRQLKKAMLAKMFPANGEKIPKIRFKGFEGEWNVWKLGAFGKATSGTSLESEFCENGKYKVISIGSYSEESTYTEQGIRANKNDKTEKRILNKNDLTMILNDKTSSGRIIGRVLLIDQNDTYVYNQRTQRIEIDQEHFIPLFLYHLLNAENIRQKIISSAQGNTQIYVNWSNIKNLEYLIPPSKAEQTAISDFFRQLDETIELQSAEVEKLNQLKKGLLAAMLV